MTGQENTMYRYLSGSATSQERSTFEQELANSVELQKSFSAYAKVWELTTHLRYPEHQLADAWNHFEQKVKAPEDKKGFDWRKLAASIILFAAFSFVIYSYFGVKGTPFVTQTNTEHILLDDASEIVLNSNSYLLKDENFGLDNRNMELEGEAYFKVSKSQYPFILSLAVGKIKVKGTAFSVLSSKDDDYACIELYEGSIIFSSSEVVKTLEAGMRLISTEGKVFFESIDTKSPHWLDSDEISYQNVPLKQIMIAIKREYGLDYHLSQKLLKEHYTVNLPKNDLQTCLSILAKVSDIKFAVQDKRIVAL